MISLKTTNDFSAEYLLTGIKLFLKVQNSISKCVVALGHMQEQCKYCLSFTEKGPLRNAFNGIFSDIFRFIFLEKNILVRNC